MTHLRKQIKRLKDLWSDNYDTTLQMKRLNICFQMLFLYFHFFSTLNFFAVKFFVSFHNSKYF